MNNPSARRRATAALAMARATKLCGILLLVLATGCGPFVLLPGGELEGRTVSVPADWALLSDTDTVQLETQPTDPYSVNIWAVGLGSSVYIHAGTNRADWVEYIEADAKVRLRVEEDLYELRATRVEAQDEFDRFADAYAAKYGRRPGNEKVDEAYLFRLAAR